MRSPGVAGRTRLPSILALALVVAPGAPACGSGDGEAVTVEVAGHAGASGQASAGSSGAAGTTGGTAGQAGASGGGGSSGGSGHPGQGGAAGGGGPAAGQGGAAAGAAGEGPGGAGGAGGGAAGGGAAGSAGVGAGAGAAGAPVEEEFLIAAAGDISNTSLSGQKITANLLDDEPYDAILTLGDNQYNDGTLSAYNSYFDKTWGKHKKKLRPTPGNHEYNTPGAKGYYAYFGSLAGDPKKGYYSFDIGSWHLIALNSSSSCGAVPCKAGSAQEKWLRQDLAAHAEAKCTLAYWHHPRFSSGEHGNNSDVADLWKALYENDVDVVLNGHDHDYERFAPQTPAGKADAKRGIVQIVVGTGGTGFRPFDGKKANSVARQAKEFGVLKMRLKPAGYDFEFVGEPGSTFVDKGSGKCH